MRHAQEQLEDSYYEEKYQDEERGPEPFEGETLTEYRARMKIKTALDAKRQIQTKGKDSSISDSRTEE